MARLRFSGEKPPHIFNGEALHARAASLASLKNRHLSSLLYGIVVGEIVTFPMWNKIKASPAAYIKEIDAFVGSRNKAILVRVTRTKGDTHKESWFDISVLSLAYPEPNCDFNHPDRVRRILAGQNDDYERLQSVAGKSLVGKGTCIGYKPVFRDGVVQRNEYGHRLLEQTSIVTVELMDKDCITIAHPRICRNRPDNTIDMCEYPYVVVCEDYYDIFEVHDERTPPCLYHYCPDLDTAKQTYIYFLEEKTGLTMSQDEISNIDFFDRRQYNKFDSTHEYYLCIEPSWKYRYVMDGDFM